MIYSRNNKNDFRSNLYKAESVALNGMNDSLPFWVCGNGPEPKNSWDNESNSYSDEIECWGIWVCQNAVDEETGEHFIQNPILVDIPVSSLSEKKANSFKFGDVVQLHNMGGFKSNRYKVWRWRADSIELVKEDKK